MSMTTELELAQRMKAAALKFGDEQWQTRDGFSGIEVIVKGSMAKGRGCVSYQPVAAELADSKTAKAIALFNPANVLALVEALEAAEKRNAEQVGIIAKQEKWIEDVEATMISATDRAEDAGKRIAELEARTVKLPEYRNSPDMHTKQFYEAIGFNEGLDAFISALRAAGVAVEGE